MRFLEINGIWPFNFAIRKINQMCIQVQSHSLYLEETGFDIERSRRGARWTKVYRSAEENPDFLYQKLSRWHQDTSEITTVLAEQQRLHYKRRMNRLILIFRFSTSVNVFHSPRMHAYVSIVEYAKWLKNKIYQPFFQFPSSQSVSYFYHSYWILSVKGATHERYFGQTTNPRASKYRIT